MTGYLTEQASSPMRDCERERLRLLHDEYALDRITLADVKRCSEQIFGGAQPTTVEGWPFMADPALYNFETHV